MSSLRQIDCMTHLRFLRGRPPEPEWSLPFESDRHNEMSFAMLIEKVSTGGVALPVGRAQAWRSKPNLARIGSSVTRSKVASSTPCRT